MATEHDNEQQAVNQEADEAAMMGLTAEEYREFMSQTEGEEAPSEEGDAQLESGEKGEEAETPAVAEPQEGEEPEPAEEGEQVGKMIPKGRLNREIERRKQAEQEAAELRRLLEQNQQQNKHPSSEEPQAEQTPVVNHDLQALNAAIREATLEGDFDKADQLAARKDQLLIEQAEQRTLQREQARRDADAKASAEAAAAEVASKYPELDPNSEEFDEVALAAAIAIRNKKIQAGKSPDAAIREAAKQVAERFGFDGQQESKPAAAKPRHVETNINAARAQPPSAGMAGRGDRSTLTVEAARGTKVEDLQKMSPAERDKLLMD